MSELGSRPRLGRGLSALLGAPGIALYAWRMREP